MNAATGSARLAQRRILGFVLRTALLYGAFLAVWPSIHGPYARTFRRAGNALLGQFSPTTQTRFRTNAERPHQDVKVILIAEQHSRRRPTVGINSQRIGYYPTAFLLALLLATPGLWPRRLWKIPAGLVVIHAFILLRVYLMLLHSFTYRFGTFRAIDAWIPDAMLDMSVLWIFDETTSSYLAGLLVWTWLAFGQARPHLLGTRAENA